MNGVCCGSSEHMLTPVLSRSHAPATTRYWEAKKEEYAKSGRKLHSVSGLQDMSEWVLGDPTATNADECAEYVAGAIADGEEGLLTHDSEHASFQIMTPGAVIRL